jgi:phospholipase A1
MSKQNLTQSEKQAVEGVFGQLYGDLWIGYTDAAVTGIASRPFRKPYEPEAQPHFNTDYPLFGWRGRLLGLSINHQSNGRAYLSHPVGTRAILNVGKRRCRSDLGIIFRN